MGLVTGIIIAAGLLLISRLLYKPPKNDQGLGEDKPTTLATRGVYLPLLLGRRRIGYIFGWAGDRFNKKESSGGGKGSGGGGGAETITWFESGWHLLCIGPAQQLDAIYANGKRIWKGPINSTTSPSGTSIQVDDDGSFKIFWGEINQPVNGWLAKNKRTGVKSRWPSICYIEWRRKKLGSSPSWPQMEYVIEVGCPGNALAGHSYWLDAGNARGVNPAQAMFQLLKAKYPHGLGLESTWLDNDSFDTFGDLMETEHLPLNMLIEQGPEASRTIQAILQDMGVVMPLVDGRLTFVPVRAPTGDIPVFSDDVIAPPEAAREVDHGDEKITRSVFTFKNKRRNRFRDYDISIDNDGEASDSTTAAQSVPIETVVDLSVANKIARRRSQELAVRSTIKVFGLRGAKQLSPGQVFSHPDLGVLRVVSIRRDDETPEVEIECTPDVYGVDDIDHEYVDTDTDTEDDLSGVATQDYAWFWVQLPESVTGVPVPVIVVLRIRGHEDIAGASVLISADGASYINIGNQDIAAAGGFLLNNLTDGTADVLVEGPSFEVSGPDEGSILDLSADTASWQAGKQMAIFVDFDNNYEITFLESVTLIAEDTWQASTAYEHPDIVVPTTSTGLRYEIIIPGTSGATEPDWPEDAGAFVNDGTITWGARPFSYQLNNLIRARLGTSQIAINPAVFSRLFIVDIDTLVRHSHPLIAAGQTLCIKTQPFTEVEAADPSEISGSCHLVTGAVATNFRVDADGNTRITAIGDTRITN